MLRSEIDELIEKWYAGTSKVFKYYQQLLHVEYVIIEKKSEDEYVTDKVNSTCKLEDMNKEEITRLFNENKLEFEQSYWSNVNLVDKKTRSCDCGSWATTNPNCHAYWCKQYRGE